MNSNNTPHLTFACELPADRLQALFDDPEVLDTLQALEAGVALGLLDLSDQRAAVVQRLNQAGIPLTAWLLLPKEQGYWFNVDNAAQARARYADFREWSARHELQWARVGLDVEPDMEEMGLLLQGKLGPLVPRWARRLGDDERIRVARLAYSDLVDRIRADGYGVESYQFPFIVDERKAGSVLLQRLFGLIDLPTDREVLMLYTSFMPGLKAGILGSYGPEAQGIAVGSTGGGVELEGGPPGPSLSWEEFSQDLRLAQRWSEGIFVFSLEGCVEQGFLSRLPGFDWNEPVTLPEEEVRTVDQVRQAFRAVLWASAHPRLLLAGLVGLVVLVGRLRGRRRAKGRG